jgi:selenophosphate synthetase-related protein
MAGLVGSLAMLLECNRLGATLDLDTLPVPAGVTLRQWLLCFPCFAFLLCVPGGAEGECLRAFAGRGLTAAVAGVLDDTGELRLRAGGRSGVAFDLNRESVTGLAAPAARPAPA